jgi:hypothetical protein
MALRRLAPRARIYYPNDDTDDIYYCHELDPNDQMRCNDGFFVNAPADQDEVFKRNLVEASMLGGLSGPGGLGIDLLYKKLQAAGL